MTQELSKIGTLIDQLISYDPKLRYESISKIKLIAKTIGPKRTREEFIPFLNKIPFDEETKTILLLVTILGEFVDLVGGEEHTHSLFPILLRYATYEDTSVRDQVIKTLTVLSGLSPNKEFSKHLYLFFKKLCFKKWISSRYTACGIIPILYKGIEGKQKEFVLKLFTHFCKNKSTLIRKIACQTLSKLILLFDKDLLLQYALPKLKQFHKDNQDSVRIQTIEVCVSFAKQLKDEQIILDEIIPIYQAIAQENSWRVRYLASKSMCSFSKNLNDTIILEKLLEPFLNLLGDDEPEVRSVGCTQLYNFCELIKKHPKVIVERIIPKIRDLSTDSCEYVKSSLAVSIIKISPIIGKDETLTNLLSHQITLFSEESAKINLPLIRNLHYATEVIGIEPLLDAVLDSINRLSKNVDWRNRVEIIKCVPLIANLFGTEAFNEHLIDLCFLWFTDIVHSVREEATLMIKKLIETFGTKWGNEFIIPKIIELSNNQNHLFRQIAIFTFVKLAPILGSEYYKGDVIETIVKLGEDPIPNIRIYLINSLIELSEYINNDEKETLKKLLESLQEDVDRDVKYFAKQTFEKTQKKN
ncbi:protein phosphatase 2 (formerly 2a) [Anaeramoeba flamelloides]|uniref:Protein phosphatase 2 (Formerly 2a) n=1 Tax=Anaeramoeba flamelloides TaxID=1746091 RepID=A0ABQ8YPG0_9EUKA|nr:protein phosphatase 2 (formerly 2a) [Anaeramoeba flamelloides]